jgi:acetyl-CoA acetyltransferase
MAEAYITGIGFHVFGRFPAKTLKEIAAVAALAALDDAGLDSDGIDAAFCSNAYAGLLNGQESIRGETWMRAIGVGGVPIINVENACASGGSALHLATIAVRAGVYRRVLVIGAEKMFLGETAPVLAALATSSDLEVTEGVGMQFAALDAIRVKEVMREESVDEEALVWIAAKNHANGALNPAAQFRKGLNADAIRSSRVIAAPIKLFMCSAISDGAAAVIVSSEPGRRAVRIRASAMASAPVRARQGSDSTAVRAARKAYFEAGLGPDSIDFAEVHDAVAPLELYYYRALGLCEAGAVARFVSDGRSARDGSMPVNTSGGLTARGHPVGATGVAQICELVLQISQGAGARQIARARRGIALNAGGWIGDDPAVNVVHILERA